MIRYLLFLFLTLVFITKIEAQPCVASNVKIKFTPTKICPGQQLTAVITKSNIYFGTGNVFTLQLSDASGGFGSPTNIGSITDTIPDTIFYELPFPTLPGNGYKLRITTTSPAHNCYISDSSLTVYPKPNPSFTFPNDSQCYKYHRYNFTSTSTISSGTITKYVWNWTDGSNNDTISTNTISHRYKFYNTFFNTELKVFSDKGCTDILKRQVNIKEMPNIETVINDNVQCLKGNLFKFNSASYSYTSPFSFASWLFGDGSSMVPNIDSAQHTYTTSNFFYVSQINGLANGCIDTAQSFLSVNPHPIAKITTNDTDQCLVGNQFIFESGTTVSNGLPILNDWTIDASVDYLLKDSVHYNYKTQGNRTIRLISTTDDGADACADTTYQKILVNPMPKVLVTNYDNTLCSKGNVFRFKAKSTIATGTVSHNWTFGDAGTATNLDSVTHTYAAAGTYVTEVKAISNKGCRDSIKTTSIVKPSPNASFTTNNNTQCLKINGFKLKSTSSISSGTYTRAWRIDDGQSFNGVDSIQFKLAAVGTYAAKLVLVSNQNCKDSIVDSLKVLAMPQPAFNINNSSQCFRKNFFTFTDNSVFPGGTITNNEWRFDDGDTTINQALVNHQYLAEADYNVALLTYGNNGCVDTAFNIVNVYPHPNTNFVINNPGQCVNSNSFVFSSATFISTGNFTNKWLFGDGTFSNQFTGVTKKYTKDSTYIVTNIAFSDHSCPDTLTKTITVYPKPKGSFTINNDKQCKLGNNFVFNAVTAIKYGTYTMAWNFGDGNVDGNFANTSHKYTNPTLYKVRLISTSNYNCNDTVIKDARVYPMPVASYNANKVSSCLQGNNFDFIANSTVSGNGSIKHFWDFGVNTLTNDTANIQNPNYSYTTEGNYTVTLISSTVTGSCKDTTTKGIVVYPTPIPSFTIDNNQQCFLNNNFNFASTSNIASGTINTTNWTFGDLTTGTGVNVAHSYIKVDSFNVIMTLTSDNLCSESDTAMVYVRPMPVADFTINPKESCLKGNRFNISNKSKITNGVIASYQFYYGNGDSATVAAPPAYSYPANGTYPILLKVTTNYGCWDTATAIVEVDPNPTLDFTANDVCLLRDSTVFTNNSNINPGFIASYKWTFGDGKTISTLQSPKHMYKRTGQFTVTLSVKTDKGCLDTLVKLLYANVNPGPTAKFTYQKLRSWENEVDIQYIDSSRGANSWFWNFSAMGTSTNQNPLLLYTDTVTQKTSLIVTNIFGCKDTSIQSLFIAPDVIYYMPNAFSPGNDDQINDFFKPRGLSYAKSYKFVIFNRWGEIMFKTDNPQLGWDGSFEGDYVEQGIYFYRLEFVGSDDLRHEEEGNIMILR